MVGIVIPAYREADNIANLVRDVLTQVPDAHVVVVDDSPDLATRDAVEQLGLAQATVVHRAAKGGRGSAVIEGLTQLAALGATEIVEMDADFSHPPTQIPALLAEARRSRLDLLIASRYSPGSRILNWPLARRLFSKGSNVLARWVLGVPVRDYTNGFRVYSPAAARVIASTCGREGRGFIALSEILVSVHYRGLRVGEVPTVFVNRVRGESSLSAGEIWRAVTGLWRIRHLRGRLLREARRST